jgi:hypothetical protein
MTCDFYADLSAVAFANEDTPTPRYNAFVVAAMPRCDLLFNLSHLSSPSRHSPSRRISSPIPGLSHLTSHGQTPLNLFPVPGAPAFPTFPLLPFPAFACFVLSLCVKDYVSLFAERFFSITP